MISLSQIDFYMFFEFARSPTNIDRTTETLSSVMNHFRQDGLTLIGLQKGKVNTNEKKLPSWLNVVSLSKEQLYQNLSIWASKTISWAWINILPRNSVIYGLNFLQEHTTARICQRIYDSIRMMVYYVRLIHIHWFKKTFYIFAILRVKKTQASMHLMSSTWTVLT